MKPDDEFGTLIVGDVEAETFALVLPDGTPAARFGTTFGAGSNRRGLEFQHDDDAEFGDSLLFWTDGAARTGQAITLLGPSPLAVGTYSGPALDLLATAANNAGQIRMRSNLVTPGTHGYADLFVRRDNTNTLMASMSAVATTGKTAQVYTSVDAAGNSASEMLAFGGVKTARVKTMVPAAGNSNVNIDADDIAITPANRLQLGGRLAWLPLQTDENKLAADFGVPAGVQNFLTSQVFSAAVGDVFIVTGMPRIDTVTVGGVAVVDLLVTDPGGTRVPVVRIIATGVVAGEQNVYSRTWRFVAVTAGATNFTLRAFRTGGGYTIRADDTSIVVQQLGIR